MRGPGIGLGIDYTETGVSAVLEFPDGRVTALGLMGRLAEHGDCGHSARPARRRVGGRSAPLDPPAPVRLGRVAVAAPIRSEDRRMDVRRRGRG